MRTSDQAETAAHAAAGKAASRIVLIDVSELLGITDLFLICSGRNERQVRTIAEEIERRMVEAYGRNPLRREGERESKWVVLDYVDFVVHVFLEEQREYYNLERLWSDAPMIPIDNVLEDAHGAAAAEAT